ncbi:uracil-DNA glycosylase family protein [Acidocella sp.]|uniref:uracil-DNA glycosylase family protein n=1 Tax=Acidocella sp. TaxID=50710 RepID=UPI002616FBB9|nr:uracil-DNA glycosylase family protein [Acidocella sp.]MDD2796299.1 uracil-DNA glycosylase family protein [Acidocella sp.]
MSAALATLVAQARACTLCAAHLPLGPRPVFRVSATAKLLIIGQAPGTRVHASGIPWNDASGERLRGWMGIGPGIFYDESRIAIMPMGFCYPGTLPNGGDAPPRPECAPAWHGKFLALMPQLQLTLLVGAYAQKRYLGSGGMAANVRAQTAYPRFLALPHPSWRTGFWEAKNLWFGTEILPRLRARVAQLI